MNKDLENYLYHLASQPRGLVYNDETSDERRQKKQQLLNDLYKPYEMCMKCPLSMLGRSKVVFGEGNPDAELMFIGEGPGRDEDLQGRPFVGRAGQLLTKIIQAMGLTREDVFITNVVKCRPPNNRQPLPEESSMCKHILLLHQIDIIQPKIICTLGSTATQALLGAQTSITAVRGVLSSFKTYKILPTYHPAYLLRNPAAKRVVWEDAQKIVAYLKGL
jgi:uracil-DNA glycosylase family 4